LQEKRATVQTFHRAGIQEFKNYIKWLIAKANAEKDKRLVEIAAFVAISFFTTSRIDSILRLETRHMIFDDLKKTWYLTVLQQKTKKTHEILMSDPAVNQLLTNLVENAKETGN
jgi:hypothetical protein